MYVCKYDNTKKSHLNSSKTVCVLLISPFKVITKQVRTTIHYKDTSIILTSRTINYRAQLRARINIQYRRFNMTDVL